MQNTRVVNTQVVKDILVSIYSVRARAKAAMDSSDIEATERLMGDLYSLEALLVSETQRLVNAIDLEVA